MASKDDQKDSGDKQFSIQPMPSDQGSSGDPKLAPFQAKPGPVVTKDMPAEEGSKAEREARKAELNK